MWVATWLLLRNLLNGATLIGNDSTSILGNASLGLLRGPYTPSPNSTFADSSFLEANYNGYARKALSAWNRSYLGQQHFALVEAGTSTFTPSGNDTVNTIYGQFMTGNDSTHLLAVEMFANPVPLPDTLHALVTTVIFGIDGNAFFGSSLVSN